MLTDSLHVYILICALFLVFMRDHVCYYFRHFIRCVKINNNIARKLFQFSALCAVCIFSEVDAFRCFPLFLLLLLLFIYIFFIIITTDIWCFENKFSLEMKEKCHSHAVQIIQKFYPKKKTATTTMYTEIEWRHVKQNRENGKWLCVAFLDEKKEAHIWKTENVTAKNRARWL